MNNLFILLLFTIILGLTIFYLSAREETKPEAKIIYSSPIGPTQDFPYDLPSKLIEVNDD